MSIRRRAWERCFASFCRLPQPGSRRGVRTPCGERRDHGEAAFGGAPFARAHHGVGEGSEPAAATLSLFLVPTLPRGNALPATLPRRFTTSHVQCDSGVVP